MSLEDDGGRAPIPHAATPPPIAPRIAIEPLADERPVARTPVPRPRRRGPGMGWIFLVVAVVLVGLVGGGALYVQSQLAAPGPGGARTVTITVASGEPFDTVVDDLATHGLIKSTRWFSLLARVRGLGSVAAGTYALDSGMSANTIVGALEASPDSSPSGSVSLTFPEGLTAAQMAGAVEKSGVGVTAQQYLAEVRTGTFNEPFLQHRPAGASLEGFLFPDTYTVSVGATAHEIVQMQLDAFAAKAAPLLVQIPASQTDYQVVTVASMVEREARFADDRPQVASVIDNRLAAGMTLGIDATVSYGLGITGEPTTAQLQQDTPYNTYLHVGLPPTPIANPGVAAIKAAASPAQTKFVYYVSDGCGHLHYAVTAAEHDRNVQTYVGQPCPSAT